MENSDQNKTKAIGLVVLFARKRFGMSQASLGKKLGGVSRETIGKWERGVCEIRDDNKGELAELFKFADTSILSSEDAAWKYLITQPFDNFRDVKAKVETYATKNKLDLAPVNEENQIDIVETIDAPDAQETEITNQFNASGSENADETKGQVLQRKTGSKRALLFGLAFCLIVFALPFIVQYSLVEFQRMPFFYKSQVFDFKKDIYHPPIEVPQTVHTPTPCDEFLKIKQDVSGALPKELYLGEKSKKTLVLAVFSGDSVKEQFRNVWPFSYYSDGHKGKASELAEGIRDQIVSNSEALGIFGKTMENVRAVEVPWRSKSNSIEDRLASCKSIERLYDDSTSVLPVIAEIQGKRVWLQLCNFDSDFSGIENKWATIPFDGNMKNVSADIVNLTMQFLAIVRKLAPREMYNDILNGSIPDVQIDQNNSIRAKGTLVDFIDVVARFTLILPRLTMSASSGYPDENEARDLIRRIDRLLDYPASKFEYALFIQMRTVVKAFATRSGINEVINENHRLTYAKGLKKSYWRFYSLPFDLYFLCGFYTQENAGSDSNHPCFAIEKELNNAHPANSSGQYFIDYGKYALALGKMKYGLIKKDRQNTCIYSQETTALKRRLKYSGFDVLPSVRINIEQVVFLNAFLQYLGVAYCKTTKGGNVNGIFEAAISNKNGFRLDPSVDLVGAKLAGTVDLANLLAIANGQFDCQTNMQDCFTAICHANFRQESQLAKTDWTIDDRAKKQLATIDALSLLSLKRIFSILKMPQKNTIVAYYLSEQVKGRLKNWKYPAKVTTKAVWTRFFFDLDHKNVTKLAIHTLSNIEMVNTDNFFSVLIDDNNRFAYFFYWGYDTDYTYYNDGIIIDI